MNSGTVYRTGLIVIIDGREQLIGQMDYEKINKTDARNIVYETQLIERFRSRRFKLSRLSGYFL